MNVFQGKLLWSLFLGTIHRYGAIHDGISKIKWDHRKCRIQMGTRNKRNDKFAFSCIFHLCKDQKSNIYKIQAYIHNFLTSNGHYFVTSQKKLRILSLNWPSSCLIFEVNIIMNSYSIFYGKMYEHIHLMYSEVALFILSYTIFGE